VRFCTTMGGLAKIWEPGFRATSGLHKRVPLKFGIFINCDRRSAYERSLFLRIFVVPDTSWWFDSLLAQRHWSGSWISWRMWRETFPGAGEFYPKGLEVMSLIDLRLHRKDHNPWTNRSITSFVKVSQIVPQGPSRVLYQSLCIYGSSGIANWEWFVVQRDTFRYLNI
jgi:hypothetical protein